MNFRKENNQSRGEYSSGLQPPAACRLFDGVSLSETEFGTETEAEKHMRHLLKKQLQTDLPLEAYMKEQRQFVNSSTYTSITELIQGTSSLEKYMKVESEDEKLQELQRCGLARDEIEFYLTHQQHTSHPSKRTFSMDPSAERKKLKAVEEKIAAHQKELKTKEVFSGAKALSRHAMDIEQTLYQGCNDKKKLDYLITSNVVDTLSDNDPFKHVKIMSDKMTRKIQKLRKRKKRGKNEEPPEKSSDDEGFCYNPSIHHVIVPLEEETVASRRLSVEEIRKMSRFESYETGPPSKVLFLKNLHPKVTIKELQLLFGRFEMESAEGIGYRILSGKMKGQAFLTFPDTSSAEQALHYVNGYVLRDKPIIIQYGKKG